MSSNLNVVQDVMKLDVLRLVMAADSVFSFMIHRSTKSLVTITIQPSHWASKSSKKNLYLLYANTKAVPSS